ncbi:hypothetical protein OC835_003625 [Tilletia horrida]|nr:hypothetical protein OC835_003625 [Tilletia horrida]
MTAQPRLPLTIVVAVSPNNGIGVGGTLPWRLAREMAYFKHVTSHVAPSASASAGSSGSSGGKNAVIMGRNTWESIPPRFRPLGGRVNVVISGTATAEELGIDKAQDTHLFASPQAALAYLRERSASQSLSRVFLMGGAQLYAQALQAAAQAHGGNGNDSANEWDLDRLLVTRIIKPGYPQCDVFLPEFRTAEQIEVEGQALGTAQTAGDGERSAAPSAPPLERKLWERASGAELEAYVASQVPGIDSLQGVQEEKGVSYEFQMWTRVTQ